jgi:hypothetical protein
MQTLSSPDCPWRYLLSTLGMVSTSAQYFGIYARTYT